MERLSYHIQLFSTHQVSGKYHWSNFHNIIYHWMPKLFLFIEIEKSSIVSFPRLDGWEITAYESSICHFHCLPQNSPQYFFFFPYGGTFPFQFESQIIFESLMSETVASLISPTFISHASKVMLKILQARL